MGGGVVVKQSKIKEREKYLESRGFKYDKNTNSWIKGDKFVSRHILLIDSDRIFQRTVSGIIRFGNVSFESLSKNIDETYGLDERQKSISRWIDVNKFALKHTLPGSFGTGKKR